MSFEAVRRAEERRRQRRRWVVRGTLGLLLIWIMLAWDIPKAREKSVHLPSQTIYFRVYADATFDGEPVVFDDVLACRQNTRQTTTWLGRRLSNGGALLMRAPTPCAYVNHYRNPWRVGRRKTKPLDEIRAPDNHLPYFLWADHTDNPTVMEAYISETYYDQPYARLKVNEVDVGAFSDRMPTSWWLLGDDEDGHDPMNGVVGRSQTGLKAGDTEWYAHALFPIREDAWRTSPILVDALGGIRPEDGLYTVPAATREAGINSIDWTASSTAMSSKGAASRQQFLIGSGTGLPRYGDGIAADVKTEVPGHGMLLTSIDPDLLLGMRQAETVMPLDCVASRCVALEDRRGYYRFQSAPVGPSLIDTVVYQGVDINVEDGVGMFYDPKTRTLWLVSHETI